MNMNNKLKTKVFVHCTQRIFQIKLTLCRLAVLIKNAIKLAIFQPLVMKHTLTDFFDYYGKFAAFGVGLVNEKAVWV